MLSKLILFSLLVIASFSVKDLANGVESCENELEESRFAEFTLCSLAISVNVVFSSIFGLLVLLSKLN